MRESRRTLQRATSVRAAATFTLNSPDSLPALHSVASTACSSPTAAAELIREVGLKCISFNGIPRTINCLNAFRAALPPAVTSSLRTRPTRTPENDGGAGPNSLAATTARGRALWDSVYAPFETKLYDKLARAHPDLPVHILHSHYAALLADPPESGEGELEEDDDGRRLGRVMTSVVAVACLRAQTGVGPQVLSHVFGLRKALSDGTYKQDGMSEDEERAARWLAGDEGSEWLLKSVDRVSSALGGSNFAQPRESKL
ncbi:Dol-P-Man:Man(5)GlcNAc(2)-PP-Dol alpha-1,3-mannosyltransferase [Beauveria bassiana]|uniref:Dol-P-Man:Man(5)GlcNAc(2)-PP-Dol alpha-1,3-mannosyltransferase n=1 Tax=Beauveria bassiana TaxID=176275 RepID=A0A2N6NK99_BEABA|nr:Dol-P-Man:Man(5)GlcNAc(2)-PP-Dol alpha-1,3-mannosyltransferase [Beauveria bassiana]